MEPKFSKGPWKVDATLIESADDRVVAKAQDVGAELFPNLYLMSSAPEMYHSIKHFLNNYILTGNATATVEMITMFSAAIAKAEGDL